MNNILWLLVIYSIIICTFAITMNDIKLTPMKKGIVGVQFLFVAFGATVLVPLLVGLDPSTALFTAGLGTFIFHLVTKGKVPIFLGSSFAFIAPIIAATKEWGMPGTLAGLTGVSLVYFIMSALVKWQGQKLLNRLFPPVVIGPVIILIGLTLSGSAVDMAKTHWILAIISLTTAVIVLTFGHGLLKLVPVICGIIVGYIAACCMGLVDFSTVEAAPWFALPTSISHFHLPEFSWQPFLFMIPVAIAPVIEHIGDVYVVSAVADKDFVKDPGLHRTLLGDGLACLAAALLAGPPVTTYSEVTGAMSITKITNAFVIRIAAATAIIFSVIGKLNALLQSIPSAVLGGIMLLLFGTIASVGIQNLIQHHVDLNKTRNILIISITLTTGIGGAIFSFGNFSMSGIGLSAIVGVFLNLVLPLDKEKATE
jgi:uracil permease